ncbi:hypothetical protein NC651_013997, partial [Populus alba x Populus x berolinensis]
SIFLLLLPYLCFLLLHLLSTNNQHQRHQELTNHSPKNHDLAPPLFENRTNNSSTRITQQPTPTVIFMAYLTNESRNQMERHFNLFCR